MAAAALALGTLLLTTAAQAEMCARPNEERALRTRVLQSDMLVAALTCGEQARYNAVVTRFQDALGRRGHDLKGLFKRVYGRGGVAHLDRFVTALANESAQRQVADASGFCARAAEMFDRLTTIDERAFLVFADDRTVGSTFRIRSCAEQVSDAGR